MLPDLAAMPVRVRPVPFETVDSYARRLGEKNLVPGRPWRAGLSAIRRQAAENGEVEHALERLGALRPGHFGNERAALPAHPDGTTCEKCMTGLRRRFGCTRCTNGDTAEQAPHDGPRVCRKHRRWVGPGTSPDEQLSVAAEALNADRAYRRLRRRGMLDAHRLAELEGCVDEWADAEQNSLVNPAKRFVIAVKLAQHVLDPVALRQLLRRDTDAAIRYGRLADIVGSVTDGKPCVVLTDAMWCLIRGVGHESTSRLHAFQGEVAVGHIDYTDDLRQMRTSFYPLVRHRHLTQFVSSDARGTRFDLAGATSSRNAYLCSLGHAYTAKAKDIRDARRSDGCKFCSRKAPLAGFNTLADTHEHLLNEWHPTMNKGLQPTSLLSGSTQVVVWRCANNHTYAQTPAARSRGVGCGYCSNHLVDPQSNALSFTHAAMSKEWHLSKNSRVTPDDVVAGSATKRWWRCAHNHDYLMAPVVRTRLGAGCPICARKVAHPFNNLAATHPEAAVLWHESKNSTVRLDGIMSGSGRRVWWQCSACGHEWLRVVNQQVRRPGCPNCVVKLLPAGTSLAETHPALAEELDTELNTDVDPRRITAGSSRYVWWRCGRAHQWRTSPSIRSQGRGGCMTCSNRRVVPGENDMATTHPELALEMDGPKNHPLTPEKVVAGTARRLWWRCTSEGHLWIAAGNARIRGHRCPVCMKVVVRGVNDFATTHSSLVDDWDYDRNGSLAPTDVLATTQKMLWWRCADGHRVRERAKGRIARGGCPECRAQAA